VPEMKSEILFDVLGMFGRNLPRTLIQTKARDLRDTTQADGLGAPKPECYNGAVFLQ